MAWMASRLPTMGDMRFSTWGRKGGNGRGRRGQAAWGLESAPGGGRSALQPGLLEDR